MPQPLKPRGKFRCPVCGKAMEIEFGVGLSKSTMGAISELAVCVHLAYQGFEVFRAVSPHCPSDLMIKSRGNERTIG